MSDPKKHTSALQPGLYLLPVTMSDCDPKKVLPLYNISILEEIKYFVVENVRTARRFLKKVNRDINIDELNFVELNEHTSDSEIPAMLSPLKEGNPLGVMSEAGCPAVADPGARLVEEAQRCGFEIFPLVGPSSILLALMGSGMNGQNFTFNGYLPIEESKKEKMLRNLAAIIERHDTTQIFIEAPYRNNRLIKTLTSILPQSLKLCVASDITGENQKIITRTIGEWKKSEYNFDKIPTIFVLGL